MSMPHTIQEAAVFVNGKRAFFSSTDHLSRGHPSLFAQRTQVFMRRVHWSAESETRLTPCNYRCNDT